MVRARFAQFDSSLEEAAADLYASRWQTFRQITLPLIAPGVAGGALLALTLSLDDVVVTQFVSGPGSTTLPVYVFGLVRRGVTPLINAVSTVMLVASMVLVGISLGLQRGAVAAGEMISRKTFWPAPEPLFASNVVTDCGSLCCPMATRRKRNETTAQIWRRFCRHGNGALRLWGLGFGESDDRCRRGATTGGRRAPPVPRRGRWRPQLLQLVRVHRP